ncbi:pentapeptide repeat-containing protein [Nocardia sp. NPDC052566]|uniref:pentapeptide repeat-containing protein n=1 Tax=Nocardia sp. NPDC052566 TaxID=3364330 RepID=UPI0037C87C73
MAGWVRALGAAARGKTGVVAARMGKGNKAIGRRAGRVRLLPAVVFALVAGLGVAYVAYQVLHGVTPTSDVKAAPLDLTRVALTVVAGVGGVVALVVAYRRQRDLEQSKFVERFGAAAAQLGATDVAVRIAGVYAMAGVADETEGLHRQQCIDVLCGYLRLPYTPELGANHQTKDVRKYPAADPAGPETERHFEYRQNDREVRNTIVRVIADHLKPDAEYSWSASNFDFRTAHFDDVHFYSAIFSGKARFDRAVFGGGAWFTEAKFHGETGFGGATFHGDTGFVGATFGGAAEFVARFGGATFVGNAWFERASFGAGAWFERATFGAGAWFERATFGAGAWFDGARFNGSTGFGRATFHGDTRFDVVELNRDARFDNAVFHGSTGFAGTIFGGDIRFDQATFHGGVGFEKAAFAGNAGFSAATFGASARFSEAVFHGDAEFDQATFSGNADFDRITCHGSAGFDMATFGYGALFGGATFNDEARFSRATFIGGARFDQVAFNAQTTFTATDFGSARISFTAPRQWGPPPPHFDWPDDGTGKPANITPTPWPPTVPPL